MSDSDLLDREVTPVFNLLLTATDHGATRMATTIDIQVVLSDVNDHSPVFQVQVYDANVLEVCRHTYSNVRSLKVMPFTTHQGFPQKLSHHLYG